MVNIVPADFLIWPVFLLINSLFLSNCFTNFMRNLKNITMTKFNFENKETLTYGEALDPIFKITDKEDAMQYKKSYVDFVKKFLDNNERKAEDVVNANIGYYAGYGSSKDRERIEDLFECSHPVFGSIKNNGVPKGKEALECGKSGRTLESIRQ